MEKLTKRDRRRLRELADIAYERALRGHLDRLFQHFQQWQAGTLSTWDLSDEIHQFHQGPNRDSYAFFARAEPAMIVAYALAQGLLQDHEIDPGVRQAIAGLLELQRDLQRTTDDES